jgi:hypothetical protein
MTICMMSPPPPACAPPPMLLKTLPTTLSNKPMLFSY